MLATKDTEGFLANFSGLARRIIAVPVHQEKGLPPEQIAAAAERAAIPARHRSSIEEALRAIAKLELDRPARIVIAGSLYLAGEALAANGTPPE
jgi:dihydrofolate synthase/folylpolyglutamate synthase